MPFSVYTKLGLPALQSTRMTLELANCSLCVPKGIARDVLVPVGKFTFPADFVVVDFECNYRVPLILGRPFLRTARVLIDVHGEELVIRDGLERIPESNNDSTTSAIVDEFESLLGDIIKQKEELKGISDPVARRRACFARLDKCKIISQGRVIHSPKKASISAISHIFPNNNFEDSFKMGNEDLNCIPNKELDKEISFHPRESKMFSQGGDTIIREVFVKLLLDSFGKLSISMSPPIRRKYHDSVAFATGCKRIKNSKRCNRKIRIPIAMWPCRVEEKMTLKEVDGQTVEEIETKIIAKDGTITRVPGKFQGYETSEEEPVEQPRRHDLYGFVDHPQLQQGNPMNEFAPHRLPQPKGNMNGWLIEDEEEVERNEVDSDLESTASSKPVWKKTTKADHDRASRDDVGGGWDAAVAAMMMAGGWPKLGRNLGWIRMGAPEFVIVGEREEMEMRV
ncbi:reverse transcriptase domain-containing protein [Tanacetum coccineum]